MKKLIAVICALTLLMTAVLPSIAEQNSRMQGSAEQNYRGNGQAPAQQPQNGNGQAPAQQPENGNGQAPAQQPQNGNGQAPVQQPQNGNGQAPAQKPQNGNGQVPAQQPQNGNGQAPEQQNGQPQKDGQASANQQDGKQPDNRPENGEDTLQKLVDDGKLSQTTKDAILNYMKENAESTDTQTPPEKPESGNSTDMQTPPEKPESDNSTDMQEPPEKPEGDNGNGASPAQQPVPGNMMPDKEMLQKMLDNGIITEEEYNIILEAITASNDSEDTNE